MTLQMERRVMTNEEFFAFVNLPENELKDFELIEGVLYEMPSPSPLHSWIVAQLTYFLLSFVRPRKLGSVFTDNTDFVFAEGVILRPDVSFISIERLSKLPHRLQVAPDIAIEGISPSNTPYEIHKKTTTYFKYGVRLFWGVYPLEKVVRVSTPNAQGRYDVFDLKIDQTLTGGDVLPDFSVSVRDLFPPEDLSEESETHE